MNDFGAPKFSRLGLHALVLSAPGEPSLENQQRIWTLNDDARAWEGIRERVPGMNNLTILFEESAISEADLRERLLHAWNASADAARSAHHRRYELPVRYGADAGPDIESVAEATGLRVKDVIELHCAREYVVYFIGFQPGFAYLGENDSRLRVPRKARPRASVPAGSVAIAGSQTGVYPCASPGGWNIIGRCETTLFDPTREPATLL
ncbi:MAG: 5-oxoprolinase subunit PxpB, partial [Candidatus Eremiobacteraeota bacterium]|nr:5-oxoprolinase subunit PxpB [Candidatus Eremiobacteraeota bacterium]